MRTSVDHRLWWEVSWRFTARSSRSCRFQREMVKSRWGAFSSTTLTLLRSCTLPYLMLRWHSSSIAWQDRSHSASWNWATSSEVTSYLQLICSKYLESLQEGFHVKCITVDLRNVNGLMPAHTCVQLKCPVRHHANSGKLLLIKWKNYGIVVLFFVDWHKKDGHSCCDVTHWFVKFWFEAQLCVSEE